MDTTRQNKINRMLQKELSEVFQGQTQINRGILVTVSKVSISPDLSVAKAYLSIFPTENGPEIIKNIQKNSKTMLSVL